MTSSTTDYYGFGLAERPILSGRRMANNGQHAARWMPQADKAFAEPYKGVTTDGNVIPGLFPLRSTGVSTKPMADAAQQAESQPARAQPHQVAARNARVAQSVSRGHLGAFLLSGTGYRRFPPPLNENRDPPDERSRPAGSPATPRAHGLDSLGCTCYLSRS